MASARDLQHDPGQPVADEVVHVAGDPAPLVEERLLGELAAGGFQLGYELTLASRGDANRPRKRDAHDPDSHCDLGGVLDHAGGDRRGCCEEAERDRCRV